MTLRNRLLLAFVGTAILVLVLFGSLAFKIASDAGLEKEMGMLKGHTLTIADSIGKRLEQGRAEHDLLLAMPAVPDARYVFLILKRGDLILSSRPLQAVLEKYYAEFPLRDLHGSVDEGRVTFDDEFFIWSRAPVRGTDYMLVTLFHTHAEVVSPLQRLAVRLLVTGVLSILVVVWGALIMSAYITRQHDKQHAAIVHQALHDQLTDLPNRSLLYDRLGQCIAIASRENRKLALMVMDLDRFKDVNDTLGHGSGDLLLQQVAGRMRTILRESDTIARLGGDEFAVVLPNADAESACLVATKITHAMSKPFVVEGMLLENDISIGIALYPDHGADKESLIRHADVAMYHAKHNGLGHAVYGPDSDPHSLRRLVLAGDLRHAIDNNELQLYFQPKLDVMTGTVVGAEALLRWRHHEFGMVPPDEFVGIAEQSGLIKPLTFWVMQEGVRQHAAWKSAGIHINMAVNLSVRNLQDRELPTQIAALLAQHHVDPAALTLEITESAVMADPKHALEVLGELHDMGVVLSIDDFGTGHSSLSYLKRLPVNEIKIDRSFVMDLSRDEEDKVIVSTIIALAHNVGLKVVAEGVENQAVLDWLATRRCDTVQGYHISRPVPDVELRDWYAGYDPSVYANQLPVVEQFDVVERQARGA